MVGEEHREVDVDLAAARRPSARACGPSASPRARSGSARSACRRRRARSRGCRGSARARRRRCAARRPTARRSTARARPGSRGRGRRRRRSAARTAASRATRPDRRTHTIRAVMEVAPRHPPHRGRPRRALRLPVPARRRGAHAAGRHRAARHAAQVIAPYLATLGRSLADLDDVLISHADVDHCGGNRALRAARAAARACCAARPTAPWIESNAAMLAGNYRWYEAYGFGPVARGRRVPRARAGRRRAGRRRPARRRDAAPRAATGALEVLALPGHTPGHLGLWDPRSGAAIVIDAVLADGVYDRAGNRLIPPRYYDAARLRGDDPPPARARPRAAAHRALRRHGARRGARVPRPLARLRARRARRGARRPARPTCAR